MTVWWLTIYQPPGNSYSGLKERKVIAQGWPHIGDLSILAKNYGGYWSGNDSRQGFNSVLKLLAEPYYPDEAGDPPASMLNLFNLLRITAGDIVVAVHAGQGAGTVMGVCQIVKNAWESYRHDDPDAFDYAHTVGFPVEWVDWDIMRTAPPNPPAMIAGIQPMGSAQAQIVIDVWQAYKQNHPNQSL